MLVGDLYHRKKKHLTCLRSRSKKIVSSVKNKTSFNLWILKITKPRDSILEKNNLSINYFELYNHGKRIRLFDFDLIFDQPQSIFFLFGLHHN